MKELVVVSGKGGTGKTSVAASFAALATGKVIADCDVDAADLHLVLSPSVLRAEPFSGGKKARILADACIGCGRCEEVCRFDAVSRAEDGSESYVVDGLACEGCAACTLVCPVDAIEFAEAVNGEWFVSDSRHGPFVHARLGIAEENSGKLVTLVRTEAKRIAEREGLGLVIIDGSPGIGCPVIASMTGASLALVVTEPTLSGRHDLERIVGVAERLGTRAAVCVNKCDLNVEVAADIENWCKLKGIPVAGRIPYDRLVTDAQLRGLSVVEHSDGPGATAIRALWVAVDGMLES